MVVTVDKGLQKSNPQLVGQNPETLRFLEAIFADKPQDLQILIWEVQPDKEPKEKISHWATSVEQAASIVANCPATSNVYFGLGLAPAHKFGRKERCQANEVAGVTSLWVDLDFGPNDGVVHKKDSLPPDLASAMQLLGELPYAPSIVWHTGFGLQAAWLLDSAWIFAGDAERKEAAQMVAAWQALIREKAAQHNWALDSTQDLARVFRVVGSYNQNQNRPGAQPQVYILHYDPDLRYDRAIFATEPAPVSRQTTVSTGTNRATSGAADTSAVKALAAQLHISPAAQPPDDLFKKLLRKADVKATWEHTRAMPNDSSTSGYDQSLADAAVIAGWPDQEICDLLIANGRQCGAKIKAARYYAHTILKAHDKFPSPEERKARVAAFAQQAAAVTDQQIAEALAADPLPEGKAPDAESAARLLAVLYRDSLAYDGVGQCWREWTGSHWKELPELASDLDSAVVRCLRAWQIRIGGVALVESVKTLAARLLRRDFAPRTDLINFCNGTLRLTDPPTLQPHDRDDYLAYVLDYDYAPGPHLLTDQFLRDTMPDPLAQAAFRRHVGLALMRDTTIHQMLIALGPKRTGKSTLIQLANRLCGQPATAYCGAALFDKGIEGMHARAESKDRLIAVLDEVPTGAFRDEELVKIMAAHGGVRMRHLYQRGEAQNQWRGKLLMNGNTAPKFEDRTSALVERIVMLPCPNRPPKLDPRLLAKLEAERGAFAATCIREASAFLGSGEAYYPQSPGMLRLRGEVEIAGNSLKAFVEDRCIVDPDARERSEDLYAKYQEWMAENIGLDEKSMGLNAFLAALKDRYDVKSRQRVWDNAVKKQIRYAVGIRLKSEADREADNQTADAS